jgi:hypothetical protein
MTRIETMDLFDMIAINGAETWTAMTFVSGAISDWRMWCQLIAKADRINLPPLAIPMDQRAQFIACCQWLGNTAKALKMVAAADAADRAVRECAVSLATPIGYDAHRLMQVVLCGDRLIHAFNAELRARHVMALDTRHVEYFSDPSPFGQQVEDAFPSAAFDIAEAAKCRALARWTACVMHLMRVLEAGLGALARHHDVPADSNWNQVLNQIEVKIREVGKRTHGPDAEQWAAEAGTHLRFIKNAWRNHAMHPRQVYDEERAVAIFENSRSFMQHLSGKLTEYEALG